MPQQQPKSTSSSPTLENPTTNTTVISITNHNNHSSDNAIVNDNNNNHNTNDTDDDELLYVTTTATTTSENKEEEEDELFMVASLKNKKSSNIVVGGGRFTYRSSNNNNNMYSYNNNNSSHLFLGNNELQQQFSVMDVVRLRFSRLLQSNIYHVFYVIMIAVCVALFVWTLIKKGHPDSLLFLYLEILVTFALMTEVTLKIFLVEGSVYFQSYWNWLDFVVSVMCVISFIIYLIKRGVETRWEALTDTTLMTFRYVSQIARIIFFIQKQRRQRQFANQQFIDLFSERHELSLNSSTRRSDDDRQDQEHDHHGHLMLNHSDEYEDDSDEEMFVRT